MTDDSAAFARLDERLNGMQGQLTDIKDTMATKESSQNTNSLVADLVRSLAEERAARILGDEKNAGLIAEMRNTADKRRYDFMIAIALAGIGIVLGIVERTVGTGLFGS